VPFYKELGNQGLKATDVPVVAFSVGEEELARASIPSRWWVTGRVELLPVDQRRGNDEFIKKWTAYAKAKSIAGHRTRR